MSDNISMTNAAYGKCYDSHVFAYAGSPPDGRIPEGWPCCCGLMVAHWRRCNMGEEHLVAEPPTHPKDSP